MAFSILSDFVAVVSIVQPGGCWQEYLKSLLAHYSETLSEGNLLHKKNGTEQL